MHVELSILIHFFSSGRIKISQRSAKNQYKKQIARRELECLISDQQTLRIWIWILNILSHHKLIKKSLDEQQDWRKLVWALSLGYLVPNQVWPHRVSPIIQSRSLLDPSAEPTLQPFLHWDYRFITNSAASFMSLRNSGSACLTDRAETRQ